MPEFKKFKTIQQLAKKHNVSVDFIKSQVKAGIDVEYEHTYDRKLAKRIALQHLGEFPDYYSHLKSMEHTGKTDNRLNRLENRVINNIRNILNEKTNPLKDPKTQIKRSTAPGALTPGAAKELGPIAVKLQKKAASEVDLPKLKKIKEAVRLPIKMGNVYDVGINWRGKYLRVNIFFPQLRMPKRTEIQSEIRKIYPDAKLLNYYPSENNNQSPLIYVK